MVGSDLPIIVSSSTSGRHSQRCDSSNIVGRIIRIRRGPLKPKTFGSCKMLVIHIFPFNPSKFCNLVLFYIDDEPKFLTVIEKINSQRREIEFLGRVSRVKNRELSPDEIRTDFSNVGFPSTGKISGINRHQVVARCTSLSLPRRQNQNLLQTAKKF